MIKKFTGTQKQWNDLVESSSGVSLMQLWEYGEAKRVLEGWQVERILVEHNGKVVMAFQALLKQLPIISRGAVYINKPVYFVENKNDILLSVKEFKEYWIIQRKLFLLCDLNLRESLFTVEEIFSLGFIPKKKEETGWATDLLSLDKSEEELRKSLHQKWRNCLNKSEKLNVQVRGGNKEEDLNAFVNDYQKVIDEIGFKPGVEPSFISKLVELSEDKNRYVVLRASSEEQELGSVIIPCFGEYAFYLASGAHKAGKEKNVSYKLLWEAACAAKRMGKKYFDLGGVNEITTPKGILHFKQGLSGVNEKWLPMVMAYQNGVINRILLRKIEKM